MKELVLSALRSPAVKGALAAALAGGMVAAGASITDPTHFNLFDRESSLQLLKMFGSGAVAGLIMYFRRPPQKPWDGVDRRGPDANP